MASPERKLKLCALPTCKGKRYDLVHKFPMNNERAQQWIDIVDLPELKNLPIDKVRKRFFICSKHFRPQDYKNCESRSLNTTAYPRLYLKETDEEANETVSSSNINTDVDELNVQEYEYVAQETAIEVDPISTEIPIKSETKQPPIQFVVCSHKNDVPIILRRNRIKKPEIVVQKSIQIQAIPNSMIVNGCTNQIDENDTLKNGDANNFILKRSANVTIEPVCKRNRLNEIDVRRTYCNPSQINQKDTSEEKSKMIEICHSDLQNSLKVCSFWLRDHCRCSICYSCDTFQRKTNIIDIPLDIEPIDIKDENNLIHVTWSDGHESSYDIFELKDRLNPKLQPIVEKCLWTGAEIVCSDYANVTLNDYLCNDDVAKKVVTSLIKFGCAFIKNVPANLQSTDIAVRRLFSIQKTNFGEMWSCSDNKTHNDNAYTTEALLAHTDNTYFTDAAALKVLHCTNRDGSGGESLFVDGFNVLKRLREQNPETYEYLSKTIIPSEYIEDDYHFKHHAPVINIDPLTNEPNQIRFNMNDRAFLNNIPQEEMLTFYKHYRIIAMEIQREENEWRFILEPGTVCIFDNWRLLHGRNEYTGRRQMVGCYVSRSEFCSVSRRYGMIS
ncbi:trimethyllysine dioxygenase, mitochondrial-like [Contarinia nasturtii]|uniref:trimethyllysine dioxygenase, mitochondrial-like n=1 Tax=Contarinia nasturtii TaxID=265458 RepID=UPI0012D420E5|nr:trimethyllysine dioxygenase, mitochondrial-like [Contarinia nasturtii]